MFDSEEFKGLIDNAYDNNSSFSQSFDAFDSQLEKLKMKDGASTTLGELIDAYCSSESEKCMHIIRVHKSKDNRTYFRIMIQDSDGDMVMCSDYPMIEVDGVDMIHWGMINKLQELAYMGYKLYQCKDDTIEEE